MIARLSLVGVASAVVLGGSFAHAQEPPAAQGAPAQVEPSAPVVPERPPVMPPPMAPPMVRRVDASEPRKITGIVLTAIGAYHGFAGSVVLGTFAGVSGGYGFLYGLLFGGPFMGEGLILTSIGVPLWVSGAKTVEKIDDPNGGPPRDAATPPWVPKVEVSAGTGTATWRF